LYYFIFLYCDLTYKEPTRKYKKPFSLIAKGLGISKLPLLESFGTFKWDIAIENIKLNRLVS